VITVLNIINFRRQKREITISTGVIPIEHCGGVTRKAASPWVCGVVGLERSAADWPTSVIIEVISVGRAGFITIISVGFVSSGVWIGTG